MRGAGGRRRPKDSLQGRFPVDTRQLSTIRNRDSDASYCSSRPSNSSIGIGRAPAGPITDRAHQASAIRVINAYLASQSCSTVLKPPLPSAKDITDTIRFIFTRLDWPSFKLEEDLPLLLKCLNCPFKLNKSALKAPGTPHSWPSLLAVIHWLVEFALYNDHIASSPTTTTHSLFRDNRVLTHIVNSYSLYIRGDDEGVEALDNEFNRQMEQESDAVAEKVKSLEKEVADLEAQLEALRSGPSEREVLEKDKSMLEKDVQKFHTIIEELTNAIVMVEKTLKEKEKELDAKVQEQQRISEENEELKKRIDAQTVNARDAERMKRELQAVERDIVETELARNAWEEKSWDLDVTIGHKLKELESLSIECNQALRRIKLGGNYQYVLNTKGSTPAEVLGIDYKATLKPALDEFMDNIKKSSKAKLEELISLQQQSVENASKIESKRNRLAALQSRIDEGEAQLNLLKKEIEDYTSRCAVEAKRMLEDVQREEHNLDLVEKEAEEFFKTSKLKLHDVIKQCDEETQMCARELLMLIDTVSKHKEYMESTISQMKNELLETTGAVADAHKASLKLQFGSIFN